VQPYTYRESPLTTLDSDPADFTAGPMPGAALPNCRLAEDDYLLDHLGSGFTLLYFIGDAASVEPGSLCNALRDVDPDLRILEIASNTTGGRAEGVLVDSGGNIRAAFGAADGTVYLVRPDRHVAARWKSADAGQVRAALQRALGGPEE
jgi:3-(3-hydroxy-phenyl)propionate hydroxylase